jgi:hypothetical protein
MPMGTATSIAKKVVISVAISSGQIPNDPICGCQVVPVKNSSSVTSGLAKKRNGCMPPGQARKWAVGQPMPRDVVSYSLPSAITVQLGVPPAGHRYVRVASDILLIAIGTGMVVDAIQDLGRL